MIVTNGRIQAARCILPVSENPDVPASMGLRHRAAIGLSEVTDAVVLVVSEETGAMSLVRNGEVYRNLATAELRGRLNEWLLNAPGHVGAALVAALPHQAAPERNAP